MSPSHDHDEIRAWVEAWKRAGPLLEELRSRELRQVVTSDAIQALNGAFQAARRLGGPAPTSGLVEQQRLLQRLRR
jgi:hypothetical protein